VEISKKREIKEEKRRKKTKRRNVMAIFFNVFFDPREVKMNQNF